MGVFNEKGLLEPGFSEYKLSEIEKIFVEDFSESQTRKEIYMGFLRWLKQLIQICIPNEIWIDGSFATSKINPNDMDLVYFINVEDANKILPLGERIREIGLQNHCDSYLAFSPDSSPEMKAELTNRRNYWRGQFGFDREDNPKGMIKMTRESLVLFLKEVIKDV